MENTLAMAATMLATALSSGCFVQAGGSLAPDAGMDTRIDISADVSTEVPDADATDDDAPDDPMDTWDAIVDTEDTDGDVPLDPVDTLMDTFVDTFVDTFTDPGECTTTWDPACDDDVECTTDFCDMLTHVCQHSGATMEGASCTGDGNECTNDYCHGGVCVHSAYREDEFCTDDGNSCTDDYCHLGVCTHDGTPRNGDACTDDGDLCTDDECQGGACTHPWISMCCYRDGDCIEPGQYWECDAGLNRCYDPPQGHFCETCDTRDDCGDGGSSSDDYCVWDGATPGCAKDCRGDVDCPRGAACYADIDAGTACGPTSTGCLCHVKLGDCATWREWGTSCSGDGECSGPDNYCFGTYCTWDCTTIADCPLESTGCVVGTCRK